jgi:hypothetical protein
LIAFCIIMMLVGAFITTRMFRRPVARLLRRIASLIDGDTASEALGPFRALHADPAVAGAMPQRRGSGGTVRLRTQSGWLIDSGAGEDIGPEPLGHDPATPSKVDRGSQSVHGMLATVSTQTKSKDFKLYGTTVYELKTMCKDRGLPVTGLKADLIYRIEQQDRYIARWPFGGSSGSGIGGSSGSGGYASAR